jgi:hypothetical protein
MTKSTVSVPKPSSYNFDNTSMFNIPEKLEVHLVTQKFNNSLRPIPTNAKPIPIPKPTLDVLEVDHPGAEVVRSDINPTKKIPHKDYIPTYVPPYYNIKETGFSNVRHDDIFRSTAN